MFLKFITLAIFLASCSENKMTSPYGKEVRKTPFNEEKRISSTSGNVVLKLTTEDAKLFSKPIIEIKLDSTIDIPPYQLDQTGILYYFSSHGILKALDTSTSDLLWSTELDTIINQKPGSISIYGEYILVTNGSQYVYCINKKDGTIKWSSNTGYILRSKPIIYDNVVFVKSMDDSIFAFNLFTGNTIWLDSDYSNSNIAKNPNMIFAEDNLIIPYSSGKISSINIQNFSLNWVVNKRNPILKISHLSNKNILVMSSSEISLHKQEDADEIWNVKLKNPLNFIETDGMIFVLDDYKRLVSINKENGSFARSSVTFEIKILDIAYLNNKIFFITDDKKIGYVDLFDNLSIKYTNLIYSPISITTSNGLIILTTKERKLIAIEG